MSLIHQLFRRKGAQKIPNVPLPDPGVRETAPIVSERGSKSFTYRPTSDEGVRPTSEVRAESRHRSK